MPNQNSNWPVIGGIAAALGAGLCCVGPFLLISLGISGAWISNLTQLEPYRPLFIVAVLILFGWAGWQVWVLVLHGIRCIHKSIGKHRWAWFPAFYDCSEGK